MITEFLKKYSPPGMDLKQEKRFLFIGYICSAVYSLFDFLGNYAMAYDRLYDYIGGKPVLNINAVMTDFRLLIKFSFIGFGITALVMLGFIIYRYAYYRQGSMSIYLMKRLPRKTEIHKRALVLPFLAVFICLLTAFLLLLLYFAVYMLATPDVSLTPNQWQKLWRISL